MSYKISRTSAFVRKYKKLPPDIQEKFHGMMKVFFLDPFHPSLRTHKLTGKLKQYYSSSIDYSYRCIWQLDGDTITLVNVGNHSIYR